MKTVPDLNEILTARFFAFDDQEKLAYFAKLVYPHASNDFLEAIFGLTTGSVDRVFEADGE